MPTLHTSDFPEHFSFRLHFHNGEVVQSNLPPSLQWEQASGSSESESQKTIPLKLHQGGGKAKGYVLRVPKGCEILKPLHIHFSFDREGAFSRQAQNPSRQNQNLPPPWSLKNVVFVEEGGQLCVVQTLKLPPGCFVQEDLMLRMWPRAKLKWFQFHTGSQGGKYFNTTTCNMEREAVLHRLSMDVQTRHSREEVSVYQKGQKARCVLLNLQVLKDREQREHSYSIHHLKPEGSSEHFSRAVLGEASKNSFHGRVHITSQAARTDCIQDSKNLLLSPKALATMRPELKIDHSEVRAKHGATTAQLSKEALFYIQSRGVDKKNATEILLFTYIQEILNHFPSEELKEGLKNYIQTHKEELFKV